MIRARSLNNNTTISLLFNNSNIDFFVKNTVNEKRSSLYLRGYFDIIFFSFCQIGCFWGIFFMLFVIFFCMVLGGFVVSFVVSRAGASHENQIY
jgi:hypothetical protein